MEGGLTDDVDDIENALNNDLVRVNTNDLNEPEKSPVEATNDDKSHHIGELPISKVSNVRERLEARKRKADAKKQGTSTLNPH